MDDDKKFYNISSYGDNLKPGDCLKIEHRISYVSSNADLSELVRLSPEKLEKERADSAAKEKAIHAKLCAATAEWETQAAETLLLVKALEYVRTPTVKHTSNKWTSNRKDSREISNMVYQMSYQIYEDTKYDKEQKKSVPCAWYVSWEVRFNVPHKPGETYYYSGNAIAGQDRKKYTDKTAAENYVQGRVSAYAHLFTELSPPIPEDKRFLFCVNNHLLPGYSLQPHEPTAQELLAFVEDVDVSPATEKSPLEKTLERC